MWSITLALPVFLLAPEATPPESGGTAWLPSKSNFVIDVARAVAIAATTCGLLCHWQTQQQRHSLVGIARPTTTRNRYRARGLQDLL